jgi:hypothetical protein
MSAIAAVILDAAAGLAVPFIKKILADRFGTGGALAGEVIDTVAGKLGVPAEDIPGAPEPELREAIVAAEPVAADLILAYVESQRLSNELQLAEMAKEQTWTWAWRPAWMYLIGFFWLWLIVAVPLANAITGASIDIVDAGTLMTLTAAYLGLYLGGHTIKDVASKWSQK